MKSVMPMIVVMAVMAVVVVMAVVTSASTRESAFVKTVSDLRYIKV